jgi:UDP-glucose 4,6-dehydratase
VFVVQSHIDDSFGNSIAFTESNICGTHSVLEASRIYGKIQRFVHISTDEVYGSVHAGESNYLHILLSSSCIVGSDYETSVLNPSNPCAATAAGAELLVRSYGTSFKLPYCIVRLSNVYGPRQYIDKLIPTFITALLQGKKMKIHGDGEQTRRYIFVDDVVRAIGLLLCKDKATMVYSIAAKDNVSVNEIAQLLLVKLKPEEKLQDNITFEKARSFSDRRYYSGTTEALKALNWTEQVTFDKGLDTTIDWYRKTPNYWSNAY